MGEDKVYIDNSRYVEFIDDLATNKTEEDFDGKVWKKVGVSKYVFTEEAQVFYDQKYIMIENMLQSIMKLYSDNELNKTSFTEENKLIAEWIGMQLTDEGWYDNENVLGLDDNTFDTLKFHEDWNWFIPVCKKIVKEFGEGWLLEEGYDLSLRYKYLVRFIKEDNEQNGK